MISNIRFGAPLLRQALHLSGRHWARSKHPARLFPPEQLIFCSTRLLFYGTRCTFITDIVSSLLFKKVALKLAFNKQKLEVRREEFLSGSEDLRS
jgi:hypothetical protein